MSRRKTVQPSRYSDDDFSGDDVSEDDVDRSSASDSDSELSEDIRSAGSEESEEEFEDFSDEDDEESVELEDSSEEIAGDAVLGSEEEEEEEDDEEEDDEEEDEGDEDKSEELPDDAFSEEEEGEEDYEGRESDSEAGADSEADTGSEDEVSDEEAQTVTKNTKTSRKDQSTSSTASGGRKGTKAPVAIPGGGPSKTASTMSEPATVYTKAELMGMKIPDLRALELAKDADKKLKKDQLVAYILAQIPSTKADAKPAEADAKPSKAQTKSAKTKPAPAEPEPKASKAKAKPAKGSKGAKVEKDVAGDSAVTLYTAEALEKEKLPDLKKIAASVGAKATGKKADIIAGILATQPSAAQPSAASAAEEEPAAEEVGVVAQEEIAAEPAAYTAAQLEGKSLKELKSIAGEVGVKATGKKADIIASILSASPPPATEGEQPAEAEEESRVASPYTEAQLNEKSVKDLKAIAAEVGAKSTGKKGDIVAAILAAQLKPAAEEPPPEPVKPVQAKVEVFMVDPAMISKRFTPGSALAVGGTLKVRSVAPSEAEQAEATAAAEAAEAEAAEAKVAGEEADEVAGDDVEGADEKEETVAEEVARKSGGGVKGRKAANKLLLGAKYSKK